MQLVSYNIQYAKGKDDRINIDRIATAIEAADIIALQEVERNWLRSNMADQPAAIVAKLPMHHWVYGPYFDVDASSVDATGKVLNRRRQFGVMILSRWPILSSRLHILPKFATDPIFNMTAGFLETVIACPGGPLRVYALHLTDVTPAERLVQIERLFEVVRRAPIEGGAWTGYDPAWQTEGGPSPMPSEAILLGDFNLLPGSPEYEALVGPMDRKFGYGRVNVSHRLVDAWVATGHAEEDGITFPAEPAKGHDLACRIDYAFVTLSLVGRLKKCWIDSAAQGSDHQPLWIEMAD